MARKGFTPEQVISRLGEAEIHMNQGISVAEASRKIGIAQQTYYHRRTDYKQVRSHSSLGYRPPAPEAGIPAVLT